MRQALHQISYLILGLLILFIAQEVRPQTNTVTAAQVQQAVLASPNASTLLQSYAGAVGSLAMFESGGQLSVYNGTCCYGVLQMNNQNIASIRPKVTPEQFRTWPLQQQVDAWSTTMSDALRSYPARTLASLGTFDGRPVTPSMVLACVQLGIGNCMTMIRSGRCNGFADINGTTICSMADRIDGTTTPTNSETTSGTETGTPAPVSTNLTSSTVINNCITDGHGHCLSISAAMEQGFINGSGHSMADLRNLIQSLTVGITLLVCAWLGMGLWREFTTGRIVTSELIMGGRSVIMIAAMILVVMTVV
jgi:hypothetical protein